LKTKNGRWSIKKITEPGILLLNKGSTKKTVLSATYFIMEKSDG
jgi:hypothetical protein